MNKRYAIGYILNYHDQDKVLELPFDLGCGVSLISIPDWAKEDNVIHQFDLTDREGIKKETGYALCTSHQSVVLNTTQKKEFQKLLIANFALWLANPSKLFFSVYNHFEEVNGAKKVRRPKSLRGFFLHEDQNKNQITLEDLSLARKLNESISSMPKDTTICTAIKILFQAIQSPEWVPRYVFLWIALESLFGSSKSSKLSFRLSQRTASFLTSTTSEAQELHKMIKKGYVWRSKAVHGCRLHNLEPENSIELSFQLETWIRKSLIRILQSPELIETFNTKKRDDYLDGLTYTA